MFELTELSQSDPVEARRVVLLGASNVTLGFPMIVRGLQRSLPQPVQVYAAHGHGRSFGLQSRVLMRRLPGIRDCRIWEDLPEYGSSAQPPLALITDVGNDLLYGIRPDLLLSWVEDCVRRLREHQAAVTIATLPIESTLRMSSVRYHATRFAFFPRSGPAWNVMRRMVHEVETGLRDLADRYSCQTVSPRGEWYGIDPIHVRRSRRPAAWTEIFSTWPPPARVRVEGVSAIQGVPFWRLAPAERDIWGQTRRTIQPAWKDGNGSSIWLY